MVQSAEPGRADGCLWRYVAKVEIEAYNADTTRSGYAMRAVSRFEASLLQILNCLLGRATIKQTLPLLVRTIDRPKCLSRDAVELIEQHLASGCVMMLSRQDGWRRERFLRADKIAEGRLWERTSPGELGLNFSAHSLDFLIWLTAANPQSETWSPSRGAELTVGDRFLHFLAFQAMRNTEVGSQCCRRELFQQSGLCVLAFPDDFAERVALVEPDFSPWIQGTGAAIVECLQRMLSERWVEVELGKERIVKTDKMQRLGNIQQQVLTAFFEELERAGRRDLARFMTRAAQRLLAGNPSADDWVRSLDVSGLRVADRAEVYAGAFTFLNQLGRIQRWARAARDVGYFDDDYAASQLFKADWEQFTGESLCQAAVRLVAQKDPLGQRAAGQLST